MSAQRNGNAKSKSITEVFFLTIIANPAVLGRLYFDIDSRSKTSSLGDSRSLGYELDLQFSRLVSFTLQ